MRRHYRYGLYVLRHKWFVFLAALQLGVPWWRAVLHDWDKYLPGMWRAYARCFYAPDGSKQYQPDATFKSAWLRHQKRNKHHWQAWILTWDDGGTECIEMPETYRLEMLADWIGTGRAMGQPDTRSWYLRNREHIVVGPATRAWLDRRLGVITDATREALADKQHEIWAHWMSYLFAVCEVEGQRLEDGSLVIPADKVKRWARQIDTAYAELNESEQDSDRAQADKIITVLHERLWPISETLPRRG